MPVMDSFRVIAVLKGELKATVVDVRPMSNGGRTTGYPKGLSEGSVFTLRLAPSNDTREQMAENAAKGNSWLVIDAREIEEQREAGDAE